MVKVIKYSKEELLKYFKFLNEDIYIFFYDLDNTLFDRVATDFSRLISDAKNIRLDSIKGHKLVVLGKINFKLINELIDELDNLDIGEFEIAEFNNRELANLTNEAKFLSFAKDIVVKSIYINKDEQVIQAYNFSL